MQPAVIFKQFLAIVAIGAIAVFLITTATPQQAPESLVSGVILGPAPDELDTQSENPELPFRLRIPRIGIDAAVESVGLTRDGAMDVPQALANAAWYNLGPRPGEQGSAVIDGHSGWIDGVPGVFNDLHQLRPGDKLYFEDEFGASSVFVVRKSRIYDPAADASGVFGSSDGKAHLNLITCEGVWNPATASYSQRLVVFTDKEEK